jgi:hypothetical protein
MLAAEPDRSITELLLVIGRGLARQRAPRDFLMVEALVAVRRDAEVARSVSDYLRERAEWLAGLCVAAQMDGELDPALSPDALAHFCLLLAMGSALVTPDLHAVRAGEWSELLSRVVDGLAPRSPRQSPVSIGGSSGGQATDGETSAGHHR